MKPQQEYVKQINAENSNHRLDLGNSCFHFRPPRGHYTLFNLARVRDEVEVIYPPPGSTEHNNERQ